MGGADFAKIMEKAVDQSVQTPTLLRLKSRFPGWLWDKCDKALRIPESAEDYMLESFATYRINPQQRETALTLVIDNLPRGLELYPPRPDDKLPASTSVDALRSVLEDAPMVSNGSVGVQKYLQHHFDGFTGVSSFEWTEEYRSMIFDALIAVVNEHGLEEGGWKTVRWEVYDKVSLKLIQLLSLLSNASNRLVCGKYGRDLLHSWG